MARTQSSLAVSADGANWVLLNASPDLRRQIALNPELDPRADAGARASPIKAVVLTSTATSIRSPACSTFANAKP